MIDIDDLADAAVASPVDPPPSIDHLRRLQLGLTRRDQRRRRQRRTVAALVGVAALTVAGYVVTRPDTSGRSVVVPAQTPTTVTPSDGGTAARPLAREDCIVTNAVMPGCDATPEQVALLLGFLPHEPGQIPHGWTIALQRLRVFNTSGGDNGPVYSQVWTPDGNPPDNQAMDGTEGVNVSPFIVLLQRPASDTQPVKCPDGVLTTVSNGSEACVSQVTPKDGAAQSRRATWTHEGVWFGLQMIGTNDAQFQSALNSIT
jgi:hypothetical protein